MKLVAVIVGYFGLAGIGLGVLVLATQGAHATVLLFSLLALLMGVAGIIASREIWRKTTDAERRFYFWAGTNLLMMFTSPLILTDVAAGYKVAAGPLVTGAACFVLMAWLIGRALRRSRAVAV
jgi:hypothetical protein